MKQLVLDWDKYASKAIEAAGEGIVLLKNEDRTLPFTDKTKVALFGRMQNNYYKSGTGSGGMVNVKHVVTILEALGDCELVELNDELKTIYADWEVDHPYDPGIGWGQEKWSQPEMELDDELVSKMASQNDVAIIVIGRTAGEDRDNLADKGAFFLSDIEEDMLEKVCKAFDKTIVLLNIGNIMDMSFISKYNPSSVMYVLQAGMYGAIAVADAISGKVNPSGSLTETIAYEISDYPADPYFGKEDILKDKYVEDVFLGYRYFSTFAPEKVMYPFGFGLSYTTFSILPESFDGDENGISAVVKITNTGDRAGKKAVLLFVSAPSGVITKPKLSLCGFEKTELLYPGQSQIIQIKCLPEFFASFDDNNKLGLGNGWVLESGKYQFLFGFDASDVSLAGEFNLSSSKMIEQLNPALAPVESFERMIAVPSEDGSFEIGFESVPVRKVENIDSRLDFVDPEIKQTGDVGIKLADVKLKKNTLDEFIAQIDDEELCLIIRGEGMNSSKVTTGTASAFGGVNKKLIEMGVPAICCDDGPSGMRLDSGKKTFSLPNTACLACTFNKELNTELYTMFGMEMLLNQVDNILAPGLNIRRHPLNGRNFEYFSEDPFVTGVLASAQLKGLQAVGVSGTAKHYCVNNRETQRRRMNSVVSERALREIYLRGFEIAVKYGKITSIMTGYNIVNGVYASANYEMNTVVLRQQWGYTGIVMSDWWADIVPQEAGGTTGFEHSIMARSQNDLYMVCPSCERESLSISDCFDMLKSNRDDMITRAELQRCAKNILKFVLDTPAMDRMIGNGAKVTSLKCPYFDDTVPAKADMYYEMNGDFSFEVNGEDTARGKDTTFGIINNKPGKYEIIYTASSELNPLAQIPMTIFYIGVPVGVITWNGTEGKDDSKSMIGNFNPKNSVIRIHFGGNGVKLKKISFKYLGELEPGASFIHS